MTREEAIEFGNMWLEVNEDCEYSDVDDRNTYEFFQIATKALEQESVLDKIRAEIEKVVWEDVIVSLDGTDEVRIPCLDPDNVFEIIDKYMAESEE